MLMLSKRKRKTKWIIYPTGKPLWMTDSNGIKFSRRIMEKMGWCEGKGLGANEQGIQEPLKVPYKIDTKGMGFKERDDDWIEYQNEFNSFLSQLRDLNESCIVKESDTGKNEIKSLEKKSKCSKARIHYQKFTREKDLSKYSENDLACILGTCEIKKEKCQVGGIFQTKSKSDGKAESYIGVTTINSGFIPNYFKKKWVSLKNVNDSYNVNEIAIQNFHNGKSDFLIHKEENFQLENEKVKKKKPKLSFEKCREVEATETHESNGLGKSEKKKKRKREKNLNPEEEPKTKRRKKNDDSVKVGLKSKKKESEDLIIGNENSNCKVFKLNQKYENVSNTVDSKDKKEFCNFTKEKWKNSHVNHSFHDLLICEKDGIIEDKNDMADKELKIEEKWKKKKREILTEKENLGMEYFSSPQNAYEASAKSSFPKVLNSEKISSEKENDLELKVSKKRKKKAEKGKYFEKNDIEYKDTCTILNELSVSQNNVEVLKNENVKNLEVEFIKQKKKKKDEKEKLIKEGDVQFLENCSSDINNTSRRNVKSINEREVSPEVELFKKRKKKNKKNKKIEKMEDLQFVVNCSAQDSKFDLEEVSFKNTGENEITSKVGLVKKKKEKLEKETTSVEKGENNDVKNCSMHINNLCFKKKKIKKEREFKLKSKSKKKKKKKSLERENIEVAENCDSQTTDFYVDKESAKNGNEKKIVQEIEFLKKMKKKKRKSKNLEEEEMHLVKSSHNKITSPILKEEILENSNSVELVPEKFSTKKKKKKKEKDRKEKLLGKQQTKVEIIEASGDYAGIENKFCLEVEKINFEQKEKCTEEIKLIKNKNKKKHKKEIFRENSHECKSVEKKKKTEQINFEINSNVSFTNNNNNRDYFNYQNNNLDRLNFFNNSSHYCDLFSLVNGKIKEEHGIESHKIEFFNEKKADKFYPGHHLRESVRRLIHWSDFTEFRGSNLEKIVGYGYQKEFYNNKLR